jgi:hypothetical protein
MIRASDPSASIYVDGELRGKGVVSHRDTKTVGATTDVRIEKEGCAPKQYSFRRNEELDVGAAVAGLFVLVPFLWVMKYKPTHSYTFRCTNASGALATKATGSSAAPHEGGRASPRGPNARASSKATDAAETAESAFADGKELWMAGKITEACSKFARSQELGPDTGTLLILADCHIEQGAHSLARMELEEARTRAQRENRPDRVQYVDRRLAFLAGRE